MMIREANTYTLTPTYKGRSSDEDITPKFSSITIRLILGKNGYSCYNDWGIS